VEQLVTDADMAGVLRCLLPAKTESDGRQVCDLIKSVSPDGHYLFEDRALHHFRNYWWPLFSTAVLNILPTIAGMFFLTDAKAHSAHPGTA
jgi:trimethylamine:corrinoid methyltransferase-like protein